MMDDNRFPTEEKNVIIKDREERIQVMAQKTSSMSGLLQMMQSTVEKCYTGACHLLCCSTEMWKNLNLCSGEKASQHIGEQHIPAAANWSPSSTVLIVNISNATLIDCVIGKDAPAVAEQQPLMQRPLQDLHGPNCFHGAHAPTSSIQISESNLSCVIIGNNNCMQVESVMPSEEESDGVCED